jgi:hypothetical protein
MLDINSLDFSEIEIGFMVSAIGTMDVLLENRYK